MEISSVRVGKRVYVLDGLTVYRGVVRAVNVYNVGCKYGFTAEVETASGQMITAMSQQLSGSYPALANYWKA